jgi:DNA-binding NtrC family response regulator
MMEKPKILYVDDEPHNLVTLEISLRRWFAVFTTEFPEQAIEIIGTERIDVLVTDQRMPKVTGLELAKTVHEQFPSVIIIILTAYDDNETMLKALNQGGIFRYLLKPWDTQDLKQTLDTAFQSFELRKKNITLMNDLVQQYNNLNKAYKEIEHLKNKLEEENLQLKDEFCEKPPSTSIIGNSKVMKTVLRQVEKAAKSNSSILLLGETGTGKELFAKTIHSLSPRNKQLLVTINCAAIPETLIESELFGHEKGTFTGADKLKYGKFELAHNGSLFLDEIGELPFSMQPKLLRVLQENEFERLGGNNLIKTDFRLIAATNRDLETEVEKGTFRQDLFYRLNILPITIPPLRDHVDDIPLLVNHFVTNLNRKTGKTITSIPKKVLDRFMEYHWPGNIRELENIVERGHVLSSGSSLEVGDWLKHGKNEKNGNTDILPLEDNEKHHILKALKQTRWRIRGKGGTAELLQINPTTLESRMKKLGIERPI